MISVELVDTIPAHLGDSNHPLLGEAGEASPDADLRSACALRSHLTNGQGPPGLREHCQYGPSNVPVMERVGSVRSIIEKYRSISNPIVIYLIR